MNGTEAYSVQGVVTKRQDGSQPMRFGCLQCLLGAALSHCSSLVRLYPAALHQEGRLCLCGTDVTAR